MATATQQKPKSGTIRVKMLTTQSGFTQIKHRNEKGVIEIRRGAQYVRKINREYDVEEDEAALLINANQAIEVDPTKPAA